MKTKSTVAIGFAYGLLSAAIFAATEPATAQYQTWQHSGSIFILTGPEGANLPPSASENGFPLLVRLHRDFFDFSQAKSNAEDIRFSAPDGKPLSFQIDEWDAAQGIASIWVRIPLIKGNERQELKLHWGKADAVSESSGSAVFNESNGFLSVWHMSDPVKDEVATLKTKDVGTTPNAGIIGSARHFAGDQGLFCGDKISGYPTSANPHTSEAWFRADKANGRVLAWGNEERQGKVVMQFRSPPHISMDCYFSDANVKGRTTPPLSQWIHVVHTYEKGNSRIYVNGVLDGVARDRGATLNIKSPARMWIGGWYDHYDFMGDVDEVRVSKVTRSADWVRLEYENQKPQQTLVGPVVQTGDEFSVSPAQVTVPEGKSATLFAQAGGAQKVYWILKSDGRETVVAVDRLRFILDAGRVTGDKSATLQLKAIYADQVKTRDIPVTIQEDIPEPAFALNAPAKWDGRENVEVVPGISNLAAMQAKGAGELKYTWSVSGLATSKEIAPGRLILKRAQNSGRLNVTLALSNGGVETIRTTTIAVREPKTDAWVQRAPEKDEQPADNQFYARDDKNEGTLFYNGTLNEAADSVFLRVYAEDKLLTNESQKLPADRSYAFSAKLKPGLIKYRVEFGSKNGGRESLLHTATNLVCGDAYLIEGQSNALATDTGEKSPPETSDWIRSYGSPGDGDRSGRLNLWCNPVWKAEKGEQAELGYWGMALAKRLLESQKIPIFIINGAVGGTRIDQHQRNPANPEDPSTIYGRLLWRVRRAKLTHGIRGVLWHQGENDQGADGPTGGFGWETYQQYFVEMSAAWKQDYPNLQHYYIFQIWPKACAMGVNGSDNMLREVQRTLPALYSHMSIMSTLGIQPPGGCHYPLAGWAEFARLIQPLIERDNYGKAFPGSITPPNLIQAAFTSDKKDTMALEFDQPVVWSHSLASQFYLDGAKDRIAAGSVFGNVVTLKVTAPSTAQRITYLDGDSWSQEHLLRGENGIAALTFCNVPISTK
jgi:hypothetical protein